ncbi:hypothetical protein HAX54_034719 [Datura stramonium]|uniref:Uncharacterized protein n=1 Tax=Datura stramonium TaxID=4076 RepID=A0ABS8VGN5_DATST|nr:hypothetical protein [Datura stramonium]
MEAAEVYAVEKEDVSVDECSEDEVERQETEKYRKVERLGIGKLKRFIKLNQISATLPFTLGIMPISLCLHQLLSDDLQTRSGVHWRVTAWALDASDDLCCIVDISAIHISA